MKINNILFLLSVAALSLQSCDKLNNEPSDYIVSSKAFRNVNDVDMGVLGAYKALTSDIIATSAIVSDEVMMPTENTVSNASLHKWQYNSSSGSVTDIMANYYIVINNVNLVLEALPNITVNSSEQAKINQYHAELLALRAFSHMEILRAYASSYEKEGMGVPYMKTSSLTFQSRPTVAANFADINGDLSAAKELMSTEFNSKIRITKKAISAIQARVALYEKNWENAIKYSTEVIDNSSLASKDDFSKVWVDQSDAEIVWKLAREGNDERLGASFYRQTGGMVLYAPSYKLRSLFDEAKDVRFASYILHDQDRSTSSAGAKFPYLVNKYIGSVSESPGLTAIKLFRTAEMYLIRAEAEAEKNGASGIVAATNDLNALRKVRIADYENQIFSSKDAVIDAIYTERFKELAFEGHRFFDLKRRSLSIVRLPQDLTDVITKSQLTNKDAQYCFPISVVEMSINKFMVQNPFYTSN